VLTCCALRLALGAAPLVLGAGCAQGHETVNGTDVRELFPDPRTRALAEAAGRGEASEVARLVKAGADPNGRGREGVVPLSWAMGRRNYAGMRALLAAGADPNAESAPGLKPLEVAAGSRDIELLRILLDAKGDPNARGANGEPLLNVAVLHEQLANLRLLVERGARVDAVDESQTTATQLAASISQWEIVAWLLEHGADPSIPDMNGATVANTLDRSRPPLDDDVRRAYDRVRSLLVSRGVRFPAETPEQVRLRVFGPDSPTGPGVRDERDAAARRDMP
jgi:ankyrin repeat protein